MPIVILSWIWLEILLLLINKFYVWLLDHSITLKAWCDVLIHDEITLHNHELVPRLMAIMRSWLKNEVGKFFSPAGIWISFPWNQKPVCYQWAMLTPLKCVLLFTIQLNNLKPKKIHEEKEIMIGRIQSSPFMLYKNKQISCNIEKFIKLCGIFLSVFPILELVCFLQFLNYTQNAGVGIRDQKLYRAKRYVGTFI